MGRGADRVRVTVLCEDLQAWSFCRHALIEMGFQSREIYRVPYPGDVFRSGEGGLHARGGYVVHACGSQHVRETYPIELAALRRLHRRAALLVHIDVDNSRAKDRTVDERVDELHRACDRGDVPRRVAGEAVALLVPRRNIETWIHFYRVGPPVDEYDAYPKLKGREAEAAPAARRFARDARAGDEPEGAPDSLLRGLRELVLVREA